MEVDLSLDEIIELRGISARSNDNKFGSNQNKTRKLVNKPSFKPTKPSLQSEQYPRNYDARNKIIQKTRAKIIDARDILNQNMRTSGMDARQLITDRKKRHPTVETDPIDEPPVSTKGSGIHKGRFGQRMITMTNHPGGTIQTLWDPKDAMGIARGGGRGNGYKPEPVYQPRQRSTPKPFAPRGYVDHDNMQELEDEEISRTLHLSGFNGKAPGMPSRFAYGGFDMKGIDMNPGSMSNLAKEPFDIYDTSRSHIERPPLPPQMINDTDSDKLFERRQRHMVTTSNLPDSLRARLFGSEPDRRVSHGIYANENRAQAQMIDNGGSAGGVSTLGRLNPHPLTTVNNKIGYRLLVSNLHANVTTSDIRELFNDIGPMHDAHVVRPGTAEVIYKSLDHAETAVDLYHQREFDGQPMHCVLVNPHSSNRSAMSVNSRTVTTNSSGVEVDIDALHSVLFRDR